MKKWFSLSTLETPEARNTLRIVALGFFAAVITASFYLYLATRYGNWQLYAWSADIWILAAALLVGGVLIRNGHVQTGAWTVLLAVLVTFPAIVLFIEGTGLVTGFGTAILLAVVAGQMLPPKPATRAIVAGIVAGVVSILLDMFLPPYRLPQPEMTRVYLPLVLIVITLLYSYNVVRNFRDYSLRTKFLLSMFVITGASLGVYGYFTFRNTNQSQALLTDELQSTVQAQAETRLNDTAAQEAHDASDTFVEVDKNLQALVNYRASLFSQTSALGTGSYWNAHSLVQLGQGQYSNSANDPGSVFLPSSLQPNDAMLEELNVSAYLDFIAPSVLKSNSNMVATYFISSNESIIYYPNIGLASVLPADFNPQDGIFYTLATPEKNPERKPVWTPPYQDPAGFGLMVTHSIPVYDQSGKFRGVMGADVQLARITERVANIQVGKSGFAFLIDSEGRVLGMTDAGYAFFGLQPEEVPFNETPKQTVLGLGPAELQAVTKKMAQGEKGLAKVNVGETKYYLSYFPLESIGYSIGLVAPASELEAAYTAARERTEAEAQRTRKTITLILIGILIATAGLGQAVSQGFLRPLARLRDTAEDIAKGNLNAQAPVESKDEIGVLGQTVNSMAAQLRELIGTLEQRVAERTKALSTVAEVGTSASTILETERLLQEVVGLTKERFGFYHAHIYLLDPAGTKLVLASGAGEPGRRMVAEGRSISLDREQSLVARAARERKGVIVNDVTQAPDFLPNPLLPDTRSELAVPMIVGGNVIGVFDVQSDEVGRFTETDANVQTTLAAQIAVAVQNARQYDLTQSALVQTEKLFEASRRLAQSTDLQELVRASVESLGISAMDRAILGVFEYEAGGEVGGMTVAANWSNNAGLPATPIGTHYPKEALKAVSLLTSKVPLFFNDMLNDERVDDAMKEVPRKLHYRAAVALPLYIGSRQDAVLLFEGENPHSFTQEEIRLFTSLAPQVATVLENRRQFERTQKQAERESMLNAISQNIQSAITVESALKIAARELGHALGMGVQVKLEPDDRQK